MASYHLTVKVGAKGRGASHASYISREDKYATKEKYEDLEHTASGNMPSWAKNNPLLLWKAADTFERSNGTAYREFEIALPREMTPTQRLDLVTEFIKKEIGEKHPYQFAIHCPKAGIEGKDQPHAHIMFSERMLDGIERDPEQFFKRANSKNPELGGAKKASAPQSYAQRKEALIALRQRWAELQNTHLEKHGHADRVDHRSLKEQGIEREPEPHLGPRRVNALTIEQATAILERRVAEREACAAAATRDSVIDLSGDLRNALAERAASEAKAGIEEFKKTFAGKQEFMKGFEAFKQEQERQQRTERKEQTQVRGREDERGFEHE